MTLPRRRRSQRSIDAEAAVEKAASLARELAALNETASTLLDDLADSISAMPRRKDRRQP